MFIEVHLFCVCCMCMFMEACLCLHVCCVCAEFVEAHLCVCCVCTEGTRGVQGRLPFPTCGLHAQPCLEDIGCLGSDIRGAAMPSATKPCHMQSSPWRHRCLLPSSNHKRLVPPSSSGAGCQSNQLNKRNKKLTKWGNAL